MHTYTNTRICSHCKKIKPSAKFLKRQDRESFYSWCTDCMKKRGRTVEYPKIKDRGYGVIYG